MLMQEGKLQKHICIRRTLVSSDDDATSAVSYAFLYFFRGSPWGMGAAGVIQDSVALIFADDLTGQLIMSFFFTTTL